MPEEPWVPLFVNHRGMPLLSGPERSPGLRALFNAQSTALATELDASEQAMLERDGIDFIADLPLEGNQLGRLIYVKEDDRVRRWNGTQWGVIGFPPSIFTEPSLGSGWETSVSLNHLYQRSGWVMHLFNGYASSNRPNGAVVCNVPEGYQGAHNVFTLAARFDGSGNPLADDVLVYYDWIDEQVKLREPLASGQSIAYTLMWPLEGAT